MSTHGKRFWMMAAALVLTLSFSFSVCAEVQTGWISRGGSWYYYNASGKQAKNQWLKSGTDLFWMDENGAMVTDTWIEKDKQWYYMGSSGAAVSGWQEIDGKYYYFDKEKFVMVTNETIDSWHVGADGAWEPSK